MADLKKANEFLKEVAESSKEVLVEEALIREEAIKRLEFLIRYLKTEYEKLVAEYEYIINTLREKSEETEEENKEKKEEK